MSNFDLIENAVEDYNENGDLNGHAIDAIKHGAKLVPGTHMYLKNDIQDIDIKNDNFNNK